MQNNPTHDSVGVASIYTSRFGEDGILLEVDFKQVEILALAILSNDKQLLTDILYGIDIHEATGKSVFGTSMTKEERRVVKTINFGLIYGGGAATLAVQAGVPKALAQKCIATFFKRYPRVKEYFSDFWTEIDEALINHGELTGAKLEHGVPQKRYVWESLTGRRYCFMDFWSDYSHNAGPSYTQTRNYPIQGLATGDLVLTGLADVWRRILPKYGNDVKLVGLVHDSLRFDLKLDRLDELVVDLKYTLENTGKSLNRALGKDLWTLPVKVTFSKGTDFFNMKEF